jgi:hypothetical protein
MDHAHSIRFFYSQLQNGLTKLIPLAYPKTNDISFSLEEALFMSFIVFILLFAAVCGWLDRRIDSPSRKERA